MWPCVLASARTHLLAVEKDPHPPGVVLAIKAQPPETRCLVLGARQHPNCVLIDHSGRDWRAHTSISAHV
jgi:hypothetical protein